MTRFSMKARRRVPLDQGISISVVFAVSMTDLMKRFFMFFALFLSALFCGVGLLPLVEHQIARAIGPALGRIEKN